MGPRTSSFREWASSIPLSRCHASKKSSPKPWVNDLFLSKAVWSIPPARENFVGLKDPCTTPLLSPNISI